MLHSSRTKRTASRENSFPPFQYRDKDGAIKGGDLESVLNIEG